MGKWIAIVIVMLLAIGAGIVGVKLYPFYRLYRLKDAPALSMDGKKATNIYIRTGTKLQGVAELLSKKDYLLDKRDFLFFARAKSYEGRKIIPGKYRITESMTYNKLINHLRYGRGRLAVKVSFHYVRNLKDLAAKVAPSIEATPEQLLKAFHDPALHKKYGFDAKTFPTMFLPDTYNVYWAISPKQFVRRMHRAYRRFWHKQKRALRRIRYTPTQISILASIVQAEQSKKIDEWPKIAGLYLNRLRRGIKLQADPTVKFALNQPGLRRILLKHLKVKSPYNTYLHEGLPPGPLSIPEKGALRAVLRHSKHDYIFMCAKPEYSGYHNFAKTLRQHNRYAKMYHRWLRKEQIR